MEDYYKVVCWGDNPTLRMTLDDLATAIEFLNNGQDGHFLINALLPGLKDTGPTGPEKIYLSRAKDNLCVLIHRILLLFRPEVDATEG